MAAKRSPKLSRAHAYWRLAAKARKAGQSNQAAHYTRIADRLHREWQNDQDRAEAMKAARR